jgi:hypothetical protein
VPSDPRPPFSFTIRSVTVGAFVIQPEEVGPTAQSAWVLRGGQMATRATLIVYPPGTTFGDWDAATTVPEAVNGAAAWYSELKDGSSVLWWSQMPGGRAAIFSPPTAGLTRAELVQLAEAVRFTAAYPARVPYRLTYLPTGFTLVNIVQDTSVPGRHQSMLQLQATSSATLNISMLDGPPSNVDKQSGAFAANPDPNWRANTTVAGRPAYCTTMADGVTRCTVDFGTFTVSVGFARLSRTEAERTVAGLTMADWTDPGTWYDVDAVLPVR